MAVTESTVRLYEELADCHDRQHENRQRDLFLILAADAALTLGQRDKAERLRQRLLLVNPHHLFKPFSSMMDALQSPDIKVFIEDLRRQFPPDLAEKLWQAQRLPGFSDQPGEPANGSPSRLSEPELKVYRMQDAPPPKVITVGTPAKSSTVAPQRGVESPYGLSAPESPPVRRKGPKAEEATGGWVTVTLFFLVLLGGLAMAAYVLVWPFLEP